MKIAIIVGGRFHAFNLAEQLNKFKLLDQLITSYPNSSKIFTSGYVTYSNLSKRKMLDVKNKTLMKYGAVSKEVATEMVNGVWKKNKVNIALSITGIAGPTGQTKEKKIGLVYIGIKTKKGIDVNEFNFKGDRTKIRFNSLEKSIDLIFSII